MTGDPWPVGQRNGIASLRRPAASVPSRRASPEPRPEPRYLVTGGAGIIGSRLVGALLDEPAAVGDVLNVRSSEEISIAELAHRVVEATGARASPARPRPTGVALFDTTLVVCTRVAHRRRREGCPGSAGGSTVPGGHTEIGPVTPGAPTAPET